MQDSTEFEFFFFMIFHNSIDKLIGRIFVLLFYSYRIPNFIDDEWIAEFHIKNIINGSLFFCNDHETLREIHLNEVIF